MKRIFLGLAVNVKDKDECIVEELEATVQFLHGSEWFEGEPFLISSNFEYIGSIHEGSMLALGAAIEKAGMCDLILFRGDWYDSRECYMLYQVAKIYKIPVYQIKDNAVVELN